MSRASVSFGSIKTELMHDEEFKSEYERLQPRYEVISEIIEARKEQPIYIYRNGNKKISVFEIYFGDK